VHLDCLSVSACTAVRDLGVIIDSFKGQENIITRIDFSHLRNIAKVRNMMLLQDSKKQVHAFVTFRLDYCNTVLSECSSLPLNAIHPLQMIQNAAARLVFNQPKFSHTTPLLRFLHWFPVAARIRFKTLMLAYKAKNGPAPSYLRDLITSHTAPRCLRSSSTARLVPPSLRLRGKYTSRLFSVLAPRWWNELPLDVCTAESLIIF
ncbi:hypothetical protein C0J50_9877, partial [Silurus asotus]